MDQSQGFRIRFFTSVISKLSLSEVNRRRTDQLTIFSINIPLGSSTELSPLGVDFLRKLFRKFDEDRDGKLSPTELKNLMSVCPGTPPWTNDFLHSTFLDENGWLNERGFLNLWVLNVALNLFQAFEQLAYLGFNVVPIPLHPRIRLIPG